MRRRMIKIKQLNDIKNVNSSKAAKFDKKLERWQLANHYLSSYKYHEKKMEYIKKLEKELNINQEELKK